MILCPAAPVNTEIDTNIAPDLTTNDMVRSGPAERSVFKELKFSDLQNYNYSMKSTDKTISTQTFVKPTCIE